MNHLELRNHFIRFWLESPRDHTKIPSSSLVPENDPTTLFTGSGMQPLIPYLLGQPHPLGKRLVDIQKCFRAMDIEEVGDNRHTTFFEMMGNWSLGDYFKKEQLTWYFEFLTKTLGFDQRKLYVTCFAGNENVPRDAESANIWKSLGMPEERIFFYGVEKNWWSRSGVPERMPVGEIGGPDSEVFYDFGESRGTHANSPYRDQPCHPNCDCGRFLEIGNSVFIQYQKQPDGSFTELPQRNVDFGGGLERTLAARADEPDVFKTDIYAPVMAAIEGITGGKFQYSSDPQGDRNFRIIADHLKAAVFLISDGALPSNKDRGYIVRRLVRRSVRFSRYLAIQQGLAQAVTPALVKIYSPVYPQLEEKAQEIERILQQEVTKFERTLESGLREFAKIAARGDEITAQRAFYLYETYGFPYELTEEEAKSQGIRLAPRAEFDQEAAKHQEQSRAASKGKFAGGLADHSDQVVKYHTATHLLQAALRQVLGPHVHQEGSNLTGERLRFDFSHPQKLTPEEIKKIEDNVNAQIQKGLERKVETMNYEEAIHSGALAFFKERYPEKVTVYSFGDFSREICGGPHVENTKTLGHFTITKEEAVSAGVRRIYARLT